jgi:hypothetical protein
MAFRPLGSASEFFGTLMSAFDPKATLVLGEVVSNIPFPG